MAPPLNARQLDALRSIADAPGKSGRFHSSFGHKPVTLTSLHYRGLIRTAQHPIIGASIYGAVWTITDLGLSVLHGSVAP